MVQTETLEVFTEHMSEYTEKCHSQEDVKLRKMKHTITEDLQI